MALPWHCRPAVELPPQIRRTANAIWQLWIDAHLTYSFSCRLGEPIFATPTKYNCIFAYKLLVFAGIPEHFTLAWYGRWGALDACKILPQGVGTICPHVWEIIFPRKNICVHAPFYCLSHVLSSLALSFVFQAKCHRQNDRPTVRSLHCFHEKVALT